MRPQNNDFFPGIDTDDYDNDDDFFREELGS